MTLPRSSRRVSRLLIGVTAILSAACAADERTTSPSTTDAAPTTVPETTTSTTAATPTSTIPPVEPHFEPECQDRGPEATDPAPADDPAFDTLAVVGSHPAIEIQLPMALTDTDPSVQPPIAAVNRIPGGLLVTVSAPSTGWFPGGMVVALDLDGTVRWVRCTTEALAGALLAPLDTAPDRFLLGSFRYDDDTVTYTWDVVSLADGSTVGSLDDLVGGISMMGYGGASNRDLILAERGVVVFAPPYGHVVDIETDGLLRLDLATWTLSTTTFPPEFQDHPAGELSLALGSDGSLLRMGMIFESGLGVPQSIERDGEWVADGDLMRSVWGPVTQLQYGDPTQVASWDATGAVLWSHELRFPGREGFMFGRSGDVAVAVTCGPADDTNPCPDERIVGLDVGTGRELWSLPGWRIVGPMGDGIAYATDSADQYNNERPTAWYVLDTTTDVVADTPSWPGIDLFSTGCCGEGEYHHTTALGGIIAAVSSETISIWFPSELTQAATIQVALR